MNLFITGIHIVLEVRGIEIVSVVFPMICMICRNIMVSSIYSIYIAIDHCYIS